MIKCPFCGSGCHRPLVRIDETTVEHVCDDCGLAFNVEDELFRHAEDKLLPTAGERLEAGDPVYINPRDGLVYKSRGL